MNHNVLPVVDNAEVKAWCDANATQFDQLLEFDAAADCAPPPIPLPAWAHDVEVSSAGPRDMHIGQSATVKDGDVSAVVGRSYFVDRETGAITVCGETDFLVKWKEETGDDECFAVSPEGARHLIGVLRASLALIGEAE